MKTVFAGCCQPLLVIGPSRHYLRNPCVGAWTHTPLCSFVARTHYFTKDDGLTSRETRSAHRRLPIMRLQQGTGLTGLQSFDYLQAPTLARPPDRTHRSIDYWAARPFTPRIARQVTLSGMWHRYVPDMGNWHGWTFTSWIAALSAAPSRTRLSDVLHYKACAFAQTAVVGTLYRLYLLYNSLSGNLTYPAFRFLILCRLRRCLITRSSTWLRI
jgi:hypothetical protein